MSARRNAATTESQRGASGLRDHTDGAHGLHLSLARPLLYLGVERTVIALEGTLCAALLMGIGVHWATIALCALVACVVHPAMVWLTAADPQPVEVYVRSRAYADYYAPQPLAASVTSPRPRPSIATLC
jgi:type IV secretory pathway TrbD component